MDNFKYGYGDLVVCTLVTEENHEGLTLGLVYRVVGRSEMDEGGNIYVLKHWYEKVTGKGGIIFTSDDKIAPLELDKVEMDDAEVEALFKDCLGRPVMVEDEMEMDYEIYYNQEQVPDPTATTYHDDVNNPLHYTNRKFKAVDVIEDAILANELSGDLGYLYGTVLKYILRFNCKGDPVKDISKAEWFLKRLKDKLRGEA